MYDVKSKNNEVSMESWVKMPERSKACWERKYLRLEGTCLCTYDHQPSSGMSPINRLDLIEKEGFTVLDNVHQPDIMGTAKSDIPFIFRVESNSATTCWPTSRSDIMALSQTDKKNWLKALKSVTSQNYLSNVHKNKKYHIVLKLEKNQVIESFIIVKSSVIKFRDSLMQRNIYLSVGFKLCRKLARRERTFIGCRGGFVFILRI